MDTATVKRVLVVDDEPTIRGLLVDALCEAGFHVECAVDGADALRLMHGWVPHAAYGAHEAAERIGAQACLTKPFELDHLVQVVDELAGTPAPRLLADDRRSQPRFATEA